MAARAEQVEQHESNSLQAVKWSTGAVKRTYRVTTVDRTGARGRSTQGCQQLVVRRQAIRALSRCTRLLQSLQFMWR